MWTEVQSSDGEWVAVDVTPQFAQSPSLEVTEQRDPENVTEVRPDPVEEVVPPDPVQDDTAVRRHRRTDALAWTSRGSGPCCASRRAALLVALRVRAVPHRDRREGGAAPLPAPQGTPAARSRAAGTSTWMPRPTPAAMPRDTFTRGELAEAFATPLGLRARRAPPIAPSSRAPAGRRRRRGVLERSSTPSAAGSRARAGYGTASPRPYR